MTKGQILFISTIFGIILAIYFVLLNYTDSYKILPLDVATTTEAPDFESWQLFSSEKGGFSVMFPNIPHQATENVLNPKSQEYKKYNMYVSEMPNGTIFMVTRITYPKELDEKDRQEILTIILDDMLSQNPDNKLKASKFVDFRNLKALDFIIENEAVVILGKSFLDTKTLTILSRISKKENPSQEEFDYFVNSFEPLKEPSA
jgi:hypothetical protein